MTSITSTLGVGSGIDTQSLVTSLVAAQRKPKDDALTARETKNQARISALGTISSAIDAFSTSLNSLIAEGSLVTQPTSSDTARVAVSAIAGTRLGDVSAELEVRRLAQGQVLTSTTPLADARTSVGQGTLTLTVGGKAVDVTIGADNDSLAGLAKAINAAGAGVSASVVTGSGGAQLVLKGATGAANAFTVALKSGDATTLGRFAYDPATTGGMTRGKEATDAEVAIDGIVTTRATNSIDDLVPGMKIDLQKAETGTIVKLGSTRPTSTIQEAMADFVAAYNEVTAQFATATAAATDSTSAGALRGNAGIAEARRQLAKLTSTPLTASATGPKTLAEIGVSTNRDGTLTLDSNRLSAAITANPDAVEAMFNPTQTSDSPFLAITNKYGAAKPGTYKVENVVAAASGTAASGTIAGVAAVPNGTGDTLAAASSTAAKGLVLKPSANVASATVTVELGIAGALQTVRDALRGTSGALTLDTTSFSTETSAIAKERAAVATRATAYQDQLTTAFARMDSRVAAYKATQSYLEQQVAIWTKSDS